MSKKIKITLDPGHSINYNRGANTAYYESNVMFKLAGLLKTELEATGVFEVYLTKSILDSDPALADRGKMAIDNNSRVFISLHSNAASTESANYTIVFGSLNRLGNQEFAYAIGDSVVDTFKANGLTAMTRHATWSMESNTSPGMDYYGVIRNAVASPGVEYVALIEHSFHTNLQVCNMLLDDNFLQKIAVANAECIRETMAKYVLNGDKSASGTTNANVNIRSGPGTSYQLLGTLPKGTVIDIYAANDNWYRFDHNGAAAYISAAYIEDFDTTTLMTESYIGEILSPIVDEDVIYTTTATPSYMGTVTDGLINIRSGPGIKYTSIARLSEGDTVEMYRISDIVVSSTSKQLPASWTPIKYNDEVAFIYKDLVGTNIEGYNRYRVIAEPSLNTRAAPGINPDTNELYNRTGSITAGSIIYATPSEVFGWSRVILDPDTIDTSETTYVNSSYLMEITTPTSISLRTLSYTIPVSYGVTTSGVNVRSTPSLTGSSIGSLTSGFYVIVLEECGDFYKILYNEEEAYCAKNYVSLFLLEGHVPEDILEVTDTTVVNIPTMGVNSWFTSTLNGTITSVYGNRTHPITGEIDSFHAGIDYGATSGTPIKTPVDGVCIFTNYDSSYGNLAMILAIDGTKHYFAHMKYASSMEVGKFYYAGSQVGMVGTTGNSTGNHLHYEIRQNPYVYNTDNMDPVDYNYPLTINPIIK